MHIRERGQGHARHFHSRILFTVMGAALLVMPALAAGPLGPSAPVVAPPKAPAVTPTAPAIPQMPVVPNNLPAPITAAPGGVAGPAKANPADDVNSTIDQVGTARSSTRPTNGGAAPAEANSISDQAAAGNLTSFLRTPLTPTTPQRRQRSNPIAGIDVVVQAQPTGKALHVTTDSKGFLPVGKLMRGETYDLTISGKDLESALDRVVGGKTDSGTPQQVLIALLLHAVQKVGTIPSGPYSRAFARGSKDQAIRLTLAVAKDGKATVDWGDGHALPLGNIKNGTALNVSFSAPVPQADANTAMSQVSTTRLGTAPNGTNPATQADVNSTVDQVSTARSGTAPTNGTTPVKRDDANTVMGQVSTTRLGTASTGGTVPEKQADVNSAIADVSTTRLGAAPTGGTKPPRQESNNLIPGIDVVVHKQPTGKSLHGSTDSRGTLFVGKLAHGESYDIQISGKDLASALDRVASGKPGTAHPQLLVALLLPAVQRPKEALSGSAPYSHAFPRASKEQGIHLTIAVAKDGRATIDWGDGSPPSLGNIKDGADLRVSFTSHVVAGDVNGDGY